MLPIVDKPLIQYAVEEAIAAGATKLVFVTGASKRAIEDHFDTDPELENTLTDSGKDELLASMREGMDEHTARVLASHGIRTREDLAECAVDEILEISDVNIEQEQAAALIMVARAPWFENAEVVENE